MNLCVSFFVLVMMAGFGADVSAQAVATAQTGGAYRSAMQREINISLHDVLLPDALREIQRIGNLQIAYAREDVPQNHRVTVVANKITVANALGKMLQGTGLAITVPGADKIVLVAGGNRKVHGVITGRVTDSKTGKGISGATISLDTDTHGIVSDENGAYRMAGVSTGTHTVVVRLVGYAKQTRAITVGEGVTVSVDFRLEPSANVLDQVVVTGSVVATKLKAVPNAITVITAKQIEERGITRIDQLFRGDIPGLFAQNLGSGALLDEVTMFSRGATALAMSSAGTALGTNPIKTYIDGVEIADPKYMSQIDPKSIERIEILTGPQASTIYGSNAVNGVMQIFTKRGTSSKPQLTLNLLSGWVENNFSGARTPQHDYSAQLNGVEGRFSYNAGGSWNYVGPWTPAKQSTRTGGFGGARLELPTPAGKITADMTLRRSITQTLQRATTEQTWTYYRETGLYNNTSANGVSAPTTLLLTGQTLGFTISYVPTSWWSQELGLGSDLSNTEQSWTARGYMSISDTILSLSQSYVDRRSIKYTTTTLVPISSLAQLTLTVGADNWQSLTSSISVLSQTLTGSLTGSPSISRQPAHNTGGFLQSQLGFKDRVFFTYGLRMEKNPTIGDKARVLPGRYGVVYTYEAGSITAKLRGSYGRSIRPPKLGLKDAFPQTNATLITLYGNYNTNLANPDLAPEHQQGGEGGLELYLGNRGSLVVTRYNQTVDNLIVPVGGVDSVRSLVPCPASGCSASSLFRDDEGYAFIY